MGVGVRGARHQGGVGRGQSGCRRASGSGGFGRPGRWIVVALCEEVGLGPSALIVAIASRAAWVCMAGMSGVGILPLQAINSMLNGMTSAILFKAALSRGLPSGAKARCPIWETSTWWGRRDSNPHGFLHVILNHARLPIPTLPQKCPRTRLSWLVTAQGTRNLLTKNCQTSLPIYRRPVLLIIREYSITFPIVLSNNSATRCT